MNLTERIEETERQLERIKATFQPAKSSRNELDKSAKDSVTLEMENAILRWVAEAASNGDEVSRRHIIDSAEMRAAIAEVVRESNGGDRHMAALTATAKQILSILLAALQEEAATDAGGGETPIRPMAGLSEGVQKALALGKTRADLTGARFDTFDQSRAAKANIEKLARLLIVKAAGIAGKSGQISKTVTSGTRAMTAAEIRSRGLA